MCVRGVKVKRHELMEEEKLVGNCVTVFLAIALTVVEVYAQIAIPLCKYTTLQVKVLH